MSYWWPKFKKQLNIPTLFTHPPLLQEKLQNCPEMIQNGSSLANEGRFDEPNCAMYSGARWSEGDQSEPLRDTIVLCSPVYMSPAKQCTYYSKSLFKWKPDSICEINSQRNIFFVFGLLCFFSLSTQPFVVVSCAFFCSRISVSRFDYFQWIEVTHVLFDILRCVPQNIDIWWTRESFFFFFEWRTMWYSMQMALSCEINTFSWE